MFFDVNPCTVGARDEIHRTVVLDKHSNGLDAVWRALRALIKKYRKCYVKMHGSTAADQVP